MKIELNATKIEELNGLIKEGHFVSSATEIAINKFLNTACDWLCSLYGGVGQAPSWAYTLSVGPIDIDGNEKKDSKKCRLESALKILEDLRNEYEMSLQLKELHEQTLLQSKELHAQTKSSRLAITISIIGLAIAVVMPSLLSKCSQDIKLDKKQFEELKETVNRRPIVVDSTCSIKCINIQDRKLIN